MSGIRRITINANPMVGDEGAMALAEALKDDLWLKGKFSMSFFFNKKMIGANRGHEVFKFTAGPFLKGHLSFQWCLAVSKRYDKEEL